MTSIATLEHIGKYFPCCTIYDVKQRSEAWHSLRKPVITASEAGIWLQERPSCRMTIAEIQDALDEEGIEYPKAAKRDALLSLLPEKRKILSSTQASIDARHKAMFKILGAQSTVIPPSEWRIDPDGPPPSNPSAWAIWNGIRLEAESLSAFEWETGLALERVGFCQHRKYAGGCSPDALIAGLPEGLESKSPLPETHLRYLFGGVLPDDYEVQVHFSMAVTGAAAWHFQSYCPGLPTFRVRVERDQRTEDILTGLADFTEELQKAKARLQRFNS